jgi:hypothetical protein
MEEIAFFIMNIQEGMVRIYHSGFFFALKFLAGIYAAVLFLDVVLLLIQRGVAGNMREKFLGMDAPRVILDKQEKAKEEWDAIRRKLESGNAVDYKVAIIEADEFIEKIIAGLGYGGENFGERLENIPGGHIVNLAGMKQAHQVRNRIIHDDNFVLSKTDALGVLSQYEEFLRSFQVVD